MSITRAWWPDAALIHNTRSNELCHVRPHVPYRDRFMCAVLCLLHYAYTQDYSEITYRLHKFSRIYNFEISKRTHCKCIHSVKPISTRKLLWKTPQHQYLEGSSHDLHFVACLMNFGEWARASSWFYTICNEDLILSALELPNDTKGIHSLTEERKLTEDTSGKNMLSVI